MSFNTLTAHAVTKTFQQGTVSLQVLRNISYVFNQKDTYALTGVSGTGKTTFLHILAGLDTPDTGTIVYKNKILHTLCQKDYSYFLTHEIGLVFQLPYLIKELSVIENIMVPGIIGGISIDSAQKRAHNLLKKTNLLDKSHSNPSELSGGQQQRIAILRALFNQPSFLLADEPTGNLDQATGTSLIDFLLQCHSEWNMGLIISSHDTYVAHKMDKVLTLHNGNIIASQS